MKLNTIHLKRAAAALATLALAACQTEHSGNGLATNEPQITFGAAVTGDADLQTRTLVKNFVTTEEYPMDFFIELCYGGDKFNDEPGTGSGSGSADDGDTEKPYKTLGTYVVPSGYSGWLESKEAHERLKWVDLTSDHTFYAWNLPWTDKGYEELAAEEMENGTIEGCEDYPLCPLTITFLDSTEDTYEQNKNNEQFHYFVGTKCGPVNYKDNGSYVELVFRHLVSKIRIVKLSLIDGPHTIQNNLKAEMTFYGMPRTATFYPHPKEDEHVGPADWDGPVVVANRTGTSDGGEAEDTLVCFIPDDPEKTIDNVFYVCPEIDFSDIVFRIDIKSEGYEERASYYGNFNNVNFVRVPGEDYDKGGDEKILHAGEVMNLVIELYKGMGPGLSVVISPWSTENANGREAVHHSRPGIYSNVEAKEVIDLFSRPYTDDELQNMQELYCERGEDGQFEKKIKIYENVEVDGAALPVGKDFQIDGMGHTITMTPKRDGSKYNVIVGPLRDVYLTDGTHTIYIDSQGYICTYDAKTMEYTRTSSQLSELTGSNVGYRIDLATGSVSQTSSWK